MPKLAENGVIWVGWEWKPKLSNETLFRDPETGKYKWVKKLGSGSGSGSGKDNVKDKDKN